MNNPIESHLPPLALTTPLNKPDRDSVVAQARDEALPPSPDGANRGATHSSGTLAALSSPLSSSYAATRGQTPYHDNQFYASAPVEACIRAFLQDMTQAHLNGHAGQPEPATPSFLRLDRVIKDSQASLHLQHLWTQLRHLEALPRPLDMRNLTIFKITRSIGRQPLDDAFTQAFSHTLLAFLKLPMADERTIVLQHLASRLARPVVSCQKPRQRWLALAADCAQGRLATSTFALYATICSAPFDASALLDDSAFQRFCTCSAVARDTYRVRPAVWCLQAILENASVSSACRLSTLHHIFSASQQAADKQCDTLGKRGGRAEKLRSEAYNRHGVAMALQLLRLHQLLACVNVSASQEIRTDDTELTNLILQEVTRHWPSKALAAAFRQNMQTWRDPHLLYAFAIKDITTSMSGRGKPLAAILQAVSAGTYRQLRLETARSLSPIFRKLDDAGETSGWLRGGSGALSEFQCVPLTAKQSTWTWHDTDDPNDFINFGSEVQGSCLHADVDYAFSQVLVTRMQDASKRLVLIKNANGTIEARAMWLMLAAEDKPDQPVLYLSKIYHNAGLSETAAIHLIRAIACRRQRELGWKLALHRASTLPVDAPAGSRFVTGLSAGIDYCETALKRTDDVRILYDEFVARISP